MVDQPLLGFDAAGGGFGFWILPLITLTITFD